MTRKSLLHERSLDKLDWDRDDVIRIIKVRNAVPRWSDEFGLYFIPRIAGRKTRKRFQEILQVNSEADVKLLIEELGL